MVFQSGAMSNESSNEENSSSVPSKVPFKTKFKLLGWLFGNPLEKFDILITASSTSASSLTEIPWPTDQNVIQNWMYLVDFMFQIVFMLRLRQILWIVLLLFGKNILQKN